MTSTDIHPNKTPQQSAVPGNCIVSIVVAVADNNAIGKNNELLWYLPADLKHFKAITSGHTVIMGRKTFESIGKPLPNRRNIIVTRKKQLDAGNIEIVHSLEEALSHCVNEQEVFIIGGAEIYRESLPFSRRIYLTTVHSSFDADTFFPALNLSEWKKVSEAPHQADEKNSFNYTFSVLERQ